MTEACPWSQRTPFPVQGKPWNLEPETGHLGALGLLQGAREGLRLCPSPCRICQDPAEARGMASPEIISPKATALCWGQEVHRPCVQPMGMCLHVGGIFAHIRVHTGSLLPTLKPSINGLPWLKCLETALGRVCRVSE